MQIIAHHSNKTLFWCAATTLAVFSLMTGLIAMACCEKYTYDIRLYLHTFVHIKKHPGLFKKIKNVLKSYQNS